MHKGKDGLVMEVREIYKISDMIHKAAGWKKENRIAERSNETV